MTGLDWLVIGGYFALLLGVAWWVIRQNEDTADDYFLAGRNLGWFVIGASIFASNIGSEHLVGLAGSGTTDGVAMAHYELHAWCLLVLGWVMVPLLWIVSNTYFQYYSLVIFLVSGAVAIGVSYATQAPNAAQIEGLTYATVSQEDRIESRGSWGWGEVAMSALVILAILIAYLSFTG